MGYNVTGSPRRDVLGSPMTTALVATGANAIVPGSGAVVGTALSLFGSLFGGGAVDQQRMARVAYFYNLAVSGNVGAAQVIAGAIPDVSGNEQPYWRHALEQLASSNPAAYAAAQAAGPARFTGTGDSATNYPHMQAYAMNWAAMNAPVVAYASPSNPAPGTYVPSSSNTTGRTQSLPAMATRAPYNWLPVVAGLGATATIAALVFSNRSRRR